MSIQQLQQHTGRSIRGQRVRRRLQAIKVVFSLVVRSKLPSQVIVALVLRVLEIVFPVGGRLPDIDHGVGDALAGQKIGDLPVHEGRVSAGRGVLDDAAAELAEGSVGRPEGAEDGGGGGVGAVLGHELVGDFVDESVG